MKLINSHGLNLSRLAIGVMSVISGIVSPQIYANVSFNSDFLDNAAGQEVDISRFNGDYRIEPGDYQPDVYLNGRLLDRAEIKVRNIGGKSRLCISDDLATRIGLNRTRLTREIEASLSQPHNCTALETIVPGASSRFSPSDMRLDFAIPQAWLSQRARGYVPPSMWSYGEKALYLSYGATYFEQHSQVNDYQSFFGDVKGG